MAHNVSRFRTLRATLDEQIPSIDTVNLFVIKLFCIAYWILESVRIIHIQCSNKLGCHSTAKIGDKC